MTDCPAAGRRILPAMRRALARTVHTRAFGTIPSSARPSARALRSAACPLPDPPIANRSFCKRASHRARTRRAARSWASRQPVHPRRMHATGSSRARSCDRTKPPDAVAVHDAVRHSRGARKAHTRRTRRSLSRPAYARTPGCRTCRRPFPAAPARAKPPSRGSCATLPAYRTRRSRPRSIATAAA